MSLPIRQAVAPLLKIHTTQFSKQLTKPPTIGRNNVAVAALLVTLVTEAVI